MNPAKLYQQSLTFRIYLLVFVILLPFILLLGIIYLQRFDTRKSQAFLTEREVCQGAKDTLTAYLRGLQKTSLVLGRIMQRLPPASSSSMNLLSDSVAGSTTVVSYSWVSPSGIILASSDRPLLGKNISRHPLFQQIPSQDHFVGNLAPAGLTGTGPSFFTSTAVRGSDGVLKGVVVAEIDAKKLPKAIAPTIRPDEGSVAVLDGNGTLVFDSGLSEVDWNTRINWKRKGRGPEPGLTNGAYRIWLHYRPLGKGSLFSGSDANRGGFLESGGPAPLRRCLCCRQAW